MCIRVDSYERLDIGCCPASFACFDRGLIGKRAVGASTRDYSAVWSTVASWGKLLRNIQDNMGNYINYRLAQWFGLDSVVGYSSPMQ